jgi:phosphohistidine swiveling domain-containing protein
MNKSRSSARRSFEWNDSLRGGYLWTNTNFGEAVTEVMTPLSWSVLQLTLEDWVFIPGYSTTGNIGGFPYLNISVFASLFHAVGRSREQLMGSMESLLYMQLPDEMDIPLIPISRWAILFGMPALLRTQLKQRQGVKRLPAYLNANPGWFQDMRERIQKEGSKTALERMWRNEISSHVKQGAWIVLGAANHFSNYALHLRRELEDLVGSEDANLLIANVNDEANLLPSLGPVVGLARVASGEMRREDYLEHYGHRGPHEFELSYPRPAEDPEWLDQQLVQMQESPVDIANMMERQRKAYLSAWQRFTRRYPRKAAGIQRRLAESARRAQLREHARSEYTRDRWLVRIYACRAGEHAGLGNDVFFLTMDELLDYLVGDHVAVSSISSRKDAYQRYKALPPYPPIIRGQFDPFIWAKNPDRSKTVYDPHASLSLSLSGTIRGAAGSAGCVEGMVRRLDSPDQADQLQPGEILVTMLTDISWTPIFSRAAAVVTDVGAPLSHAAIVARELGIPAVVGCRNATARLKTGDRVRVDGAKGVVEILEDTG